MKSWLVYFHNQINTYWGKTTEEKYKAMLNGNIYIMAKYCKSSLSGWQSAQLITDLDLKRDPGMLSQRMLAYFLYPVDIRGIHGEEPNAIIAFEKLNATKSIPENFEILFTLDENNLLAIKKRD